MDHFFLERGDKMKETADILTDYREGDFERRLDLFLSYRLLRPEFIDIDQEDLSSGNAFQRTPVKTRDRKTGSVIRPLMRWLRWGHSYGE
jgi:hypothetical protein